jgi:hypothetical protein
MAHGGGIRASGRHRPPLCRRTGSAGGHGAGAGATAVGPRGVHVGRNVGGSIITGDHNQIVQVAPQIIYPITNLPPANPHFIGRRDHLDALTQAAPGATTTITQTIAGLGGVGKSQLMLQFAHQQRPAYDIVWWLRVDEALA